MIDDDEYKRGRTFFDFMLELLEQSRYWIILAGSILFFGVWFIVHWNAESGKQISVWGLIEYVKKKDYVPEKPEISGEKSDSIKPPVQSNDQTDPPKKAPIEKQISPIPTPPKREIAEKSDSTKKSSIQTEKPQIIPLENQIPIKPQIIPIPKHTIAVFAVDENYRFHAEITQKMNSIIHNLEENTVILPSNVLNSAQKFEAVFNGNSNDENSVELLSYSRYTALAKIKVSLVQNSNLENLITANISLELRVIESKTGSIQTHFILMNKGVGFSQAIAEEKGMNKILQELEGKLSNVLSQLGS